MASRAFTRSTINHSLQITKQAFSRSYTSASLSAKPPLSSSFIRHRSIFAVVDKIVSHSSSTIRCYSSRPTTTSLQDSSPNWSNRPPKETILLDGCDFEHWLVVVEPPQNDPTRDEIIDSYIKTLAKVIGSEDEARMKIYSVSTKHYFAFGALVSEEMSYKLKELPGVRWVLPDSYLDVKNKDYGGEPFIDGKAVEYDKKYHEEWVRNSQRANERNKSGSGRRNNPVDRQRVYENRNNENRPRQNPGGPPPPNFNRTQQQGHNDGSPQLQNYTPPPPQQGFNSPPPPQQGYNSAPPPQGYNNRSPPPQGYNSAPPPQGNVVNTGMPPQGAAMNPVRGNVGNGMPPPHANFNGQQQQMPQQWNSGVQPNYSGGPPPNYGGNQPQNYGQQQMQGGYSGPQNTGGQNFQQQRNPTSYDQQAYPPPLMGGNSGGVDGGIPYTQQNMPGRDLQ